MKRWVIAAICSSCVIAIGALRAATPAELRIGGMLRDVTLQGLNGPPKNLSAFRGEPLLINVWASWCGPCREEMASLERLAWLPRVAQFRIIGVSTDDDPAQAKAFLTFANATISQFIDNQRQIENMLGADRLPLTVLVDARGRVLEKFYGARQWDSAASLQLIGRVFAGEAHSARASAR